jgi:acyl carrier protein
MTTTPADVESTVKDFLTSIDKLPEGFTADTSLYADGAELDSLETAELSATLEDVLGSDPYSAGEMPETLAQIQAFYAAASA